jgi:succinyl-CoA synthetase alpha subunit
MNALGILVGKESKVMVQGITGKLGSRQTKLMLDYRTQIVAGVTPGKANEVVYGVPVYDSVEEASAKNVIDVSVLYVPAPCVKEAAFEAFEAGVKFVVIITDRILVHDELEIRALATRLGTRYIGPNCPGMIIPHEITLGMLPPSAVSKGSIGVVSRSGTLTGEVTQILTEAGMGQSCVIGIGGDPIVGMRLRDVIELYEHDEHTKAVLIIGEIGGTMEEEAAEYIDKYVSKPIFGFISGRNAPREKRMGHAGAIIEMGCGSAESKINALQKAGVKVAENPWDLPKTFTDMQIL